jgi:hypothetical protein
MSVRPGFCESKEGLLVIYNGDRGRVNGFGRGGWPGREVSWGRYSFGVLPIDVSLMHALDEVKTEDCSNSNGTYRSSFIMMHTRLLEEYK